MFVYTSGATAIARDLSVSATYIGYQISIAYFAATLCTLFSGGITRRLGAVSCLAVAMTCVAIGAMVTTLLQLTGMFPLDLLDLPEQLDMQSSGAGQTLGSKRAGCQDDDS